MYTNDTVCTVLVYCSTVHVCGHLIGIQPFAMYAYI